MGKNLDYRFFQLTKIHCEEQHDSWFLCVYNLELKSLGQKAKNLHISIIHTLQCGSNTNEM